MKVEDYKLIPLTGKYAKGLYAKVSPEDYEDLVRFRWHGSYNKQRGRFTGVGRALTVAEGGVGPNGKHRSIRMHNYLMRPPKGMVVDHINGDPLDNRRENLRICTMQENLRNRDRSIGQSKYKGVYLKGGKWFFQFQCQCDSEEEAARLYNTVAQIAFGEFARLNKIKD